MNVYKGYFKRTLAVKKDKVNKDTCGLLGGRHRLFIAYSEGNSKEKIYKIYFKLTLAI